MVGVVSASALGIVMAWALSWSCTFWVAKEEAHTNRPPATRRTAATMMPVQEMSLSNELRMVVCFPVVARGWWAGAGSSCTHNLLLTVVVDESTGCLVRHTAPPGMP